MASSGSNELFSNDIERAHWATLDRETQRSFGQFWTPYSVARAMAAYVCGIPGDVLDPAAGSGVFARALAELSAGGPRRTMVATDLDAGMVDVLRELAPRLTNLDLRPEVRDFFTLPADLYAAGKVECEEAHVGAPRFGAVLTNPPYLNHAQIEGKQALIDQVERETGLRLHGLSNLYIYFLIRLTAMLADGGRMSAIVPAEFLDSTYGRPVKRFLLERGYLRAIIAFGSGSSIFDGAMTTAAVLLIENASLPRGQRISFLRLPAADDVAALEDRISREDLDFGHRYEPAELDPDEQWRHYFDGGRTAAPAGTRPLSVFATAIHGITTGHNGLFVLRGSQARAAGLDPAWLAPTVGKSNLIPDSLFTDADLSRLDADDKPVWMVRIPAEAISEPAAAAYLSSPTAIEAQGRTSVRGRKVWHELPTRAVAPIWISNLSRSRIKVVLNETEARPLDSFHGLIPRTDGHADLADLLRAYAVTPAFAATLRSYAREYGHGLLKMETSDLLEVPVPDFGALDPAVVGKVKLALTRFRGTSPGTARHEVAAEIESLFAG